MGIEIVVNQVTITIATFLDAKKQKNKQKLQTEIQTSQKQVKHNLTEINTFATSGYQI